MRAALVALAVFSVFLFLSQQAGAQSPSLTATNLRFNSATLTFSCSTSICPSGGWYHARSNNPSGTCSSNIPYGTYTAHVTGLSPDTEYSYLAYDDSGCSNRIVQNPVTFRTPALTASGITETSATLNLKNWTRDWWYKEEDTTDCKKVSPGISTPSLAGLQRGTTYKYYAYGSTGCSGLFIHNVRFQTTVPTGRPPKVDGFKVTGSEFSQLNLKWTKPTNGWNITSYYVMYKRSFENSYETSGYAGNEDATSYTLSGLQPDSTYNLKMYYVATPDDKKKKSFVISNHSSVLTAKTKVLPVAPPGAVTNLKVTASSPKRLTASWEAVSGATGYAVTISGAAYVHARQLGANTTSYESEVDLTVGETYTFKVQAKKTGADGAWSTATGIPLSAAPGQVTGVSVTPGVGELTVSWSAVSGATGYKVQWKSSGQSNWSQNTLSGGSTTTSTITGLTAGTAYTVQVRATKTNAFDGTWSASKTGTPKAPTPGKVGGVSVSPPSRGASNLGKLDVGWDAISGATGFHVQWKSGAQGWSTARQDTVSTGSATSDTITGLANGTTYTVRVRATRTYADNGEWSDESTGTTNAGPPGRATIASVTPDVGTLSVSWGSVSDVTGYYVQWKSGNQDWSTSRQNTETGTSGTITGLTGGTTYAVRVIAYNADGDGQPSQSMTGIPRHQRPDKVTGVSAEGQVQQLRVTWSAVTNASGYVVQWRSGNESFGSSRQNTETGTASTITGLTGGTDYTVQVRATRTHADDGEWSDMKTGTPKDPLPGQVTGVSATNASELSGGSWVAKLAVSWDAVTDASSYVIELKSSTTTTIPVPSGTNHTISNGLTGGTEYTVRVKAKKDNADDGDWSAPVTGRPNKQQPSPVTGLTLTAGIEQLTVSWTAPAAAPAPEKYRVQWKSGTQEYTEDPDEKRHAVVVATETSYTIQGLVGGTDYTVQVVATIQYADDSDPAEATETPEQAPSPQQQPGDPGPGAQPGQQGPGGPGGGPDGPGGDDIICPDYAPTETAGDVETIKDPDSLVEFVKEARIGVESILDEETEESDATARLVGCFGVEGDWKSGSVYLFAITDKTTAENSKYFLAPSGSELAGTYLDLADENGCDVAAEITRAARGEALRCDDLGLLPDGDATGFVQYLWDNPADPGDDNLGYEDRGEAPGNSPKLSYVEAVTDEDILPGRIIILGSGYYPDWTPPSPPSSGGGESGGGGCAVAGNGSKLGGAVLNLLLAAGFVAAFAASRKKPES